MNITYPKYPFLPFLMNNMSNHKTVPAPRVLSDDPWFGPAFISDTNRQYLEQKKEEENKSIAINKSKESDNIHEIMYNMSVKSSITTLDLNPINIGGSENYGDSSELN